MDLCGGLVMLGIVLVLVTLAGHGIWLVAENLFRAVFGVPKEESRSARCRCPGCGTTFARRQGECPGCGLDPESGVADELRDLEITAGQVQVLVEQEGLDPAVGEQVYQQIEARQDHLLGGRARAPADGGLDSHFRQRLDRLLSSCPDVRRLSATQRQHALAWYQQIPEHELPRLSVATLVPLARILRVAGLMTRALRVYEILLSRHSQSEETARAALEGARFAFKEHHPDMARAFLQLALRQPLSGEDRQTALDLREALGSAATSDAAAVVPSEVVPSEVVQSGPEGVPAVAGQVENLSHEVPARSWGQMLAGFMEERNILWGELVGGLLIVGCSIALVISLWRTLEQIPYFPFLIFAAITAALFGAGLYTLSHWKLEATSRGLLVIATLLTPLDFLVLAGLSHGRDTGPLAFAAELLVLSGFTALVWRSARVLMGIGASTGEQIRYGDWLFTLAAVGASATQLLVPRWLVGAQPTPWLFAVLSLAPVVFLAVTLGLVLKSMARQKFLVPASANKLFLFLGPTLFAVTVALGFIVYWSDEPLWALRHLAVPIAVAGWQVLVCGAFLHDRLAVAQDANRDRTKTDSSQVGHARNADLTSNTPSALHGLSPAAARLAGIVLALSGAAIMVAALALAWPRPLPLILIGCLNAAVLSGVALGIRLPAAHGPALACLAIGYLTAFQGLRGEFTGDEAILGSRLWALAASPASGAALTFFALLLTFSSEILSRTKNTRDSLVHVTGAGIAGVLALVLVSLAGNAEPGRAALVYAVCGLGGIGVNVRLRQRWLTAGAAFVLLGSMIFTVHWWDPALGTARLCLVALLGHATVLLLGSFLLEIWAVKRPQVAAAFQATEVFTLPLRAIALLSSVLAVTPLLTDVTWDRLPASALCSLWLAGLWLATAWQRRWPGLFAACQAATALAVLFGASAWLHGQAWVGDDVQNLTHPRSLQTYGLGLAGLSLVWVLARLGILRRTEQPFTIRPTPLAQLFAARGVDWVIAATAVVGHLILVGAAVWPEVLREAVPVQLHRDIVRLPGLDLPTAWALLGVSAGVLLVSLWSGWTSDAVLGSTVWAVTAAGVVAYGWREELAAASVVRWVLAAVFLGGSGLLWARSSLRRWGEQLGISSRARWDVAQRSRVLLVAGTVVPVLLITLVVAAVGLYGRQPAGPGADTLFAWMGWTANVVVPLCLVVVGLTGHCIRENAAGYIFAAGLVLLGTVTGGYALGVVTGGGLIDAAESIFIGQLAISVAALWALAWLGTGRWRNGVLLALQASMALAVNLVLLLPALGELLAHGSGAWPAHVLQTASWPGWLGLFATMAATLWAVRLWLPGLAVHVLGCAGLGLGILAACAVAPGDVSGWRSYHILTLVWTALALAMLVTSWAGSLTSLGPAFWSPGRRERAAAFLGRLMPARATRRWVESVGLAVVLLALGGAWGDPGRPYWSCFATLAVCLLHGALAVWTRRPSYVYASGLLLQVVAFLVWQAWLVDRWGLAVWFVLGPGLFDSFLLLQVLALAAGSLAWSLVEHRLRGREPSVDLRSGGVPYAHAAVLLAVQLLALLGLAGLAGDLFHLDMHVRGPLVWWALAATAVALVPCLWDSEAGVLGLPLAPLYVLGLAAGSLSLHQWALPPRQLGWYACLWLAGHVFIAHFLSQLVPGALVQRLRAAPRAHGWLAGWFLPAQALLALPVVALGFWICLDFPTAAERLAGPVALALLAATGLLRVRVEGTELLPSRWTTLALITLASLSGAWALLDPATIALWLHRNVLALSVLVTLGAIYRFGLGRLPVADPWAKSGRQLGNGLLGLAGLVMAAILVQEFFLYDHVLRTTPLAWPGVLLVAGLLAALMVGALWLAVARGNPGHLADAVRVRCVWGAELMLLLMLIHLRLNVPDLFPSHLGRHWPFVLMVLGFVGVGLAELFRRRGLAVLTGPLHQTGLFLPLVPLLGYMVRPLAELNALSDALPGLQPIFRYLERLPHSFALHALLWFLLGLLYAVTALLRRASLFALLAALAANFGLWVIYAHHQNLAFLLHPQIWLLPVGLILLAAEHIHRDSLTPGQAQGVRYAGLLVIYLSSTADMFITGVGRSFTLPVVLALLAIAGVLAGILLRVRAFLFTGVAFLFLVVFAQIWHAAVDRAQTWVWWACGIVLGAAILTLFALFEKRRNDVLRVLESLKRWR